MCEDTQLETGDHGSNLDQENSKTPALNHEDRLSLWEVHWVGFHNKQHAHSYVSEKYQKKVHK